MQDFFTKNLWHKLSEKWADALSGVQPEEIAYFFFEVPSMKSRQHSQRPKYRWVSESISIKKVLVNFEKTCSSLLVCFCNDCPSRNVWPLELLAFLTTCHALKLENQKFSKVINKADNTKESNSTQKLLKSKTFERKGGACDTNSTGNSPKVSEHFVLQHGDEDLSNSFRRHIKLKKQYEINCLSKVR